MNFHKNFLKSLRQELRNIRSSRKSFSTVLLADEQKQALKDLESKGIAIVQDYYSKARCAEIINEIENILSEYADKIWIDQYNADHRIFGADNLSGLIRQFFEDEFINAIICNYERSLEKKGFVMAARLKASPGNVGSGQGWHRDSPASKQTKAIIYLTDTEADNGPFQYLEGSHKPLSVLNKQFRYHFELNQSRFTDNEINKILTKRSSLLQTVTGSAGTLIITDTRGIHRGAPIKVGVRYALTDYLWFDKNIPEHIAPMIIQKKNS